MLISLAAMYIVAYGKTEETIEDVYSKKICPIRQDILELGQELKLLNEWIDLRPYLVFIDR
jgi:hypothetical protein